LASSRDMRGGRHRAELCTAPASKRLRSSLCAVVVVGGVDTVDNHFHRRSGAVFCPPRLWAAPVDNQALLWTAESCAHPMHRLHRVLPSCVPRNTQVLPSPTHLLGVTAFTRSCEWGHRLAEQWTQVWRSGPLLCTRRGILWAGWGQPPVGGREPPAPSTVCGSGPPTFPQPAELRVRSRGRPGCGGRSGQLRRPQGVDSASAPFLWRNGTGAEGIEQAGHMGTPTGPARGRPPDPRREARRPIGEPGGTRQRPGSGASGACGQTLCRRGRGGRRQLLMRFVSSVTWL
jgi:hypothetical protein